MTYHRSGLWNTITHGNALGANPVLTTQTQDALKIARPAKIESKVGATTLWKSGTYAYDRSGNIRQILGNEEGGNDQFLYDKVGRLVRAELDVPNPVGDALIFADGFESSSAGRWVETWPPVSHPTASVQTFSYDRFGNLLTMPIDGTGPALATSLATNHLTSGNYDGRGNLIAYSSNSYLFDNLNRLQKETKASGQSRYFLYTADDERILTYDPNLPSIFHFALRDFNGKVLRTFDRVLPDPSNTLIQYSLAGRDYIHAGDRVIGTADPKQPMTTRMWATLDHLGTPRLWTGPNTEALRKHKYYPYGEEMTPSDQWNVALQFTGHERDTNNLGGPADDGDNMHARSHSPLAGRFLSVENVRGNPFEPQSFNRYSYVTGSPLSFKDPNGNVKIRASRTDLQSLDGSSFVYEISFQTKGQLISAMPMAIVGKFFGGPGKGVQGAQKLFSLGKRLTVGKEFQTNYGAAFDSLWGQSSLESKLASKFKEIGGKEAGGSGSGLYTASSVALLDKAVDLVIADLMAAGSIDADRAASLRAAYNISETASRSEGTTFDMNPISSLYFQSTDPNDPFLGSGFRSADNVYH